MQLEERRRQQEAELRRVEEEKQRTLSLHQKERELREKLVNSLLNRNLCSASQMREDPKPQQIYPLNTSENLPYDSSVNYVTSTSTQTPPDYEPLRPYIHYANSTLHAVNGVYVEDSQFQEYKQINIINPGRPLYSLSILGNKMHNENSANKDSDLHVKESGRRENKAEVEGTHRQPKTSKYSHTQDTEHKHKPKFKRDLSREEDDHRKVKKSHKKHSSRDYSPRRRSVSSERSRNRGREKIRYSHKEKKHHRRSYSKERRSWSS